MSTKARESKVALSIFLFQGATSADIPPARLLSEVNEVLLTDFIYHLVQAPSLLCKGESHEESLKKVNSRLCFEFFKFVRIVLFHSWCPNFGLPNCREVPSFTAFSSPMFPLTKHVWGLCWSYIPHFIPACGRTLSLSSQKSSIKCTENLIHTVSQRCQPDRLGTLFG